MKDWLAAVLLSVGVLGPVVRAVHLEAAHSQLARAQLDDDAALRSPGPTALRITAMQHHLGVADLFWLGVVQEIGARRELEATSWQRAEYRADIATDLDSAYFTVYHSLALAMLAFSDRFEEAEALLLKGWTALPSRWEFPLSLGYSAYFLRGEPDLGAEYMSKGALIPGAPSYLGALAGRMQFHAGDEAGAIMLLTELIEHLEEPARSEAEARLKMLQSEPRLEAYDRACQAWLARTGSMPAPEMLEAEVGEPAEDLLGSAITFDAKCVARTALIKTREFEARRRVGAEKKTAKGSNPEPRLDVRVDESDR